MIRFGPVELAIYPNKPLDSMDFKSKYHSKLEFGQT